MRNNITELVGQNKKNLDPPQNHTKIIVFLLSGAVIMDRSPLIAFSEPTTLSRFASVRDPERNQGKYQVSPRQSSRRCNIYARPGVNKRRSRIQVYTVWEGSFS